MFLLLRLTSRSSLSMEHRVLESPCLCETETKEQKFNEQANEASPPQGGREKKRPAFVILQIWQINALVIAIQCIAMTNAKC